MNLIISLFYAPMVLILFKNFEIKTVSILVFVLSLFWFLISFKKGVKEYTVPLLYIIFSVVAYFLNNILLLKILPAFISILLCIYILYSYFTNNSFIFEFLKKFGKSIDKKEKDYIQNSTPFWFFIALLNLVIHCYILYLNDIIIWTFYASLGWYFVFIFGAIVQFIHRKFIFNKEKNV
ncbi:hypothetical protein [Aliarcobacter butzleri]|uniref:hypothetical protein n=1 Tax=Aliarcobacter butzleri TaxID=28197 RepID=UPI00062E7E51|nr:hypothetical protein [Aliarcobacter butzleri]KLD99088.1 hypothetical protein AF74_00255 [Aliarcobacter butzleri L349]